MKQLRQQRIKVEEHRKQNPDSNVSHQEISLRQVLVEISDSWKPFVIFMYYL